MKNTRNPGLLVLAVWLILTGLIPFLRISIPERDVVMAVLALVAGVLILVGR